MITGENDELLHGINLGTSAMKFLLMDAAGKIHNVVTKEYPLEFPSLVGANRTQRIGRKRCLIAFPNCFLKS